jgi:peptidoglycan-N-acetylglucosamine deacetylase
LLFRTPFPIPLLYPGLTWRIPTEEKEIYLTFDDGPVPGPTEFILGELKKHSARATLFCIGDNVRKHPEIFKQILKNGHAVGNHTYNHVKGWSFGTNDYAANVERCKWEMMANGYAEDAAGHHQKLFRPPYGRIKRSQIRALHDYRIIMWDVLTYDYSGIAPEKCLTGSIKAIRPGSIVVLHDSIKAEKNMSYVLPRLLDHFSGLNYSFKSL